MKKLVFKKKGKVTKGKSHKTRPEVFAGILREYEPMEKEDMVELMTSLWKEESGKEVPTEMEYLVGKYLSLLCALGIVEKTKDGKLEYQIEG